MNIRNQKLKQMMTGLAAGLGCVCAGAFLFMASPMHADAIVLGSGNQGTSAPADSNAGAEEGADDNGAAEAAGSSIGSVTVTADSVNVRSDASTSSSKAGKAEKGMELTVTGEKQDSEGKTWYAVSFESNGKTVTGYIRYDLVEAHAAEAEPAPEEQAPAETEDAAPEAPEAAAPAVTDDYYIQFEDDGTGSGTSEWYLHDNTMGNRYKVSELLGAQDTNQKNQEMIKKQTGSLKMVVIVMAVVILILIIVVTVFIIKLKNAYGDEYDDDDDEDDDEYEEEDEDEEEEERPRRKFGFGRSKRDYDDEDEDEEDEEEEEEEEDEEDYRPARRPSKTPKASKGKADKNWQSKNFLDDDDLEFEFLDLK